MATVVILDDEPRVRKLLKLSLVAEGYHVFTATTADEVYTFLAEITSKCPCSPRDLLVITDIRMPEVNGLEVIAAVHEKYPDLPFIICSSMVNTPIVEDSYEIWAAKNQIIAQFDKPLQMPKLLSTLNGALDK